MSVTRILTLLSLSALLMACSDTVETNDASSADIPSNHARLVSVIEQGRNAALENDQATLSDAVDRLKAMKAYPLSGMADLARDWSASGQTVPPMRGRVQGPGYRVGDLAAGETDRFNTILYGVEEASISVSGTGQHTIDILDVPGQPALCEDQRICIFVPEVTARYEIVVRNGGEAGTYIVVID